MNVPDNVETYKICDIVRSFEVPAGITSVTFVATTPIWATGGQSDPVTVVPLAEQAVYVPANLVLSIKFDQALAPFVGVLGHTKGVQGFVTCIWHNNQDELDALVEARAFFASQ